MKLKYSKQTFYKYLGMALLSLQTFAVQADISFNPHSFADINAANSPQCLECHKTLPARTIDFSGKHVIPQMNNYKKPATTMCTDCHGSENTSHIVGITPDYTVPADLPLDHNNQITCLTCHYTHGSLHSDKPMASSSFMDLLFNRERLSKSYILRRNNADGDLCLACHSQ